MGMGFQERSQRGECFPELLLRNVRAAVLKGKLARIRKSSFSFRASGCKLILRSFFKPRPFLGFAPPPKSSFC